MRLSCGAISLYSLIGRSQRYTYTAFDEDYIELESLDEILPHGEAQKKWKKKKTKKDNKKKKKKEDKEDTEEETEDEDEENRRRRRRRRNMRRRRRRRRNRTDHIPRLVI